MNETISLDATVNLDAALWTACALRNEVIQRFGLNVKQWYYYNRQARFPQADRLIAGYPMYTQARAAEVIRFFEEKERRKAAAQK